MVFYYDYRKLIYTRLGKHRISKNKMHDSKVDLQFLYPSAYESTHTWAHTQTHYTGAFGLLKLDCKRNNWIKYHLIHVLFIITLFFFSVILNKV